MAEQVAATPLDSMNALARLMGLETMCRKRSGLIRKHKRTTST